MIRIIIKHRNNAKNTVQKEDTVFQQAWRETCQSIKYGLPLGPRRKTVSCYHDPSDIILATSYGHLHCSASNSLKLCKTDLLLTNQPTTVTPILETYPQKINSNKWELEAVRKERVVREDNIECHGLLRNTRSLISWCPHLTILRLNGKRHKWWAV